MIHNALRWAIGIVLLSILVAPGPGQETGQFYKTPETAAEFWRALKHEIELGQFKVAANYLKGFLAKNPTDEELLQIQEREGSSAFQRLLTIPDLRAEAKPLVQRVNDIVQKHLSDPKRLDTFITNLSGDPQERSYAIAQLRRSGAVVMPALIDAFLQTAKDPTPHSAILSALPQLSEAIVPALVAAFDVGDAVVRGELVDILHQRAEIAAAPDLWYLAASPKQPAFVRAKAAAALSAFLEARLDTRPPPKAVLTQEAERYYQHRVAFVDPGAVTVWQWDGKRLVSQELRASQAEEYFGLRFARQALDLDPTYQPAQVIFLSLALEKGFERIGLDQPLSKGAPAVKDLLSSVNPDLVVAVLERALYDQRLPVILGATRALGDLAEVRAGRPDRGGAPALVRALNYPDRRVQMAAADAILRIPGPPPPATARVVEVLRRALASDETPKVLIADNNQDRAEAMAKAVKEAGFEPLLAPTGRDVLQRLSRAADVDAILVDAEVPDPPLALLLSQLRSDVNAGLLPVLVTANSERVQSLEQLVHRYKNVWVMPATLDAKVLKATFATRIGQAAGQPLSEVERKDNASRAIEWLVRLGRGEVAGYDIRPAEGAILDALRSNELAPLAVEAAGRLPGREPQRALANVVLSETPPEPLRSAAAIELCRHIQQYGLVLNAQQVKAIKNLFDTASDARLKANISPVMGSMRPDARQTGERLQRYVPTFSAPAKPDSPAAEPKDKKDNPPPGE